MEYGYNFDDESPSFTLTSLWFLLGVIVFGFTVLIRAAIVAGGPDRDYYLNVQQEPAQQTRPAVTRNNVPTIAPTTTSSVTRHNR